MSFRRISAVWFLCALVLGGPQFGVSQAQSSAPAAGPVLLLFRALRTVGLDPHAVYKVREAVIEREDVHLWLNDGTIVFAQAVDGHVTGAYFEGEGEVLVRPPDRMERASLGRFTGSGVLEEKFTAAYLRFNDDTARELQPYLRAPSSDAAEVAGRNDAKARMLAEMDALRICISFTAEEGGLAPVPDRLLHARLAGERYGAFDIIFDTRSPEQILVGKPASMQDTAGYYDLWMSFPMRSLRKPTLSDARFGGPSGPLWTPEVFSISKYTIAARLQPPRELSAEATLDIQVKQGGTRIVLFELSRYLQVTQVTFAGKPLEFIQNEAVEGSEMSRKGNDIIAVVFPAPLQPGAHFSLHFSYSGAVISDAGGGLFYVGARGTWYPNRGIAMADYDLTFRFPRPWSLIATGKRTSLQRDGNEFVGHWVSETPIPLAGFNLGEYVHSAAKADNAVVDAFAAAGTIDRGPGGKAAGSGSTLLSPHAPGTVEPVPAPPQLSDAGAISQALADRAAASLTALSRMLGPYPFSTLSLTENPTPESQGWPGLIFLSTYAYLTSEQLETLKLTPADQIIYSEVMMPHELGHQWFGDEVVWASYHEQWLMEALANYCSLMLLERTRPADVQLLMETYRQVLASRSGEGHRNVEAGPVTLGVRLSSSHFPNGYEFITYGRGTWLLHMIRTMLHDASRTAANPAGNDEAFLTLLRSLVERYQGKQITNADFEQAVEDVLPQSLWFEGHKSLDWFFDGWVNGTAFPQFQLTDVKLSHGAGPKTMSATVRQTSAAPDLVTSVPLYGVDGERRTYLGRIFAEGEETHFTLPVPDNVKHFELDPYQSVLTAP